MQVGQVTGVGVYVLRQPREAFNAVVPRGDHILRAGVAGRGHQQGLEHGAANCQDQTV